MEQRLHLLAVIEHGSVDNAWCLLGEVLEILVVSSYHTHNAALVELLEDCLRYGAANLRLGAAAKFIDEHQ